VFESRKGQNISLLYNVQTCNGAHSISYPTGMGILPQRVKKPGRECDHSAPTSAQLKNKWTLSFTPPYVTMAS
jgi:hypothetical protein